jgi:integrase
VKTKTISAALQAANAPVGVHKIAGVAGLYLKIGETGAGSYFYRYRLGDRRREIGLGSRDKVSLADACKAAKAWAVLRDEGHDPIETRRRERADNLAKSRAQQPITFKQMAETYLQAHGASWKHRYAKAGWWNPLAKFAFPIIGGLSLDEIEISHITAIMLRAEKAGAPDTARRVRSRIELVLNAAIAQGLRTATLINPAGGKLIAAAHPSKRKGERPHYRAVKIDDAQEVFRALKAEEGSAFGAWLFMVLTAARPSEALEARWAEVDFDRRLWTLPPERMKSAKQHVVPL